MCFVSPIIWRLAMQNSESFRATKFEAFTELQNSEPFSSPKIHTFVEFQLQEPTYSQT